MNSSAFTKRHFLVAIPAPVAVRSASAETVMTRAPSNPVPQRWRNIVDLLLAVACLVVTPVSNAAVQSTFSTEHLFGGGTDAASAAAGPTEFAGKLFGTTYFGGTTFDKGAIYSYDPSVPISNYQVLYPFPPNGSMGTNPAGPLTNNNGIMYGTTSKGGAFGNGTIFSFQPNNVQGTFTIHHHFTAAEGLDCFGQGTDGDFPAGALVFKGSMLYGTRCAGGASGFGTVYRMKPGIPATFESYSFTGGPEGRLPVGGLKLQGGKLYGVAWLGGAFPGTGGAIYSVDPAAPTLVATNAYSFPIAHSGGAGTLGTNPSTTLVFKQGYFYGVSDYGGQYNAGTVFKLQPGATWQNTVLHDVLPAADGCSARGQLVFVGNNLYGTNGWCAVGDYGTVWKLKVTNNTYSVIHYFSNTTDSSIAMSGLTAVSTGTDLFGASFGRGGTKGSIFRITTP